jgi:tetratricopeptide (TPR) repeat protein
MLWSRKLALALVLLLLLPLAVAQIPEERFEPIVSALRAREFDKAIELSRDALRDFPNDPRLWTMQAMAFASRGDNKQALAAFRQALKISPDYMAALEGAAQIQYQAGSQEAVPLLNHLLRLRPADRTAHAMLAVIEYRGGNCTAAASHFEKAGALLDSQLDALHAYATCLVRLKQLDAAVEVFRRVIVMKPHDPQERRLLASIQIMAHKPQDALATLQPLLEVSNPDAETLELASTAHENAGDTPQAVNALRQAILREPRNINLYLDFANLSLDHQSFQVGINVISDGIGLEPKAASLYLARGILYVQLADYERAEADFEKAHELDPSQSLSAAAQGLAAVQQNDLDRALATVQSKLAKKPHDAYLLYLQADFLTQKGAEPGTPEFQTAMTSVRKAVALQPTLAAAHEVLAKLYMQDGKYEDAAVQCRKALQIDPKDQTALYRLIQALRKTGNRQEIPSLLKQLAALRMQATKEEREKNRYRLVEGESTPAGPAQP